MEMDSKLYDRLAWLNRVFIPLFIAFLGTVLAVCGVNAAIIAGIGTIGTALVGFLGGILQNSKKKYDAAQNELKEE